MLDLQHLSYSSITSYLTCSAQWKYKYVDQSPTYSTPELTFGSAIHETVEQYVAGEGARDLLGIWPEAWEKQIKNPRYPIVWGADTPEQHFNEGVRILGHPVIQDGIGKIRAARDAEGAKIERRVELRVPGVPIPIIGFIDLVMADGTPADFKTSKSSWTQDKAQSSLQSLFYLAALNQAGDNSHRWKFRHVIVVKTKTPQFQILDHSHKPGEIFWLFGMIRKVWKGIELGVFPENANAWSCSPNYCDFWKDCRGKWV